MSKARTKDGFTYEMTKAETEDYFWGDAADVLGQPKPKGMWEAMIVAPILDENDRKEFLANHCECPLVRQLIQGSMKEVTNNG